MKKIFIVAIAAMLCCVMLVPVSANDMVEYNGHEMPNIHNLDVNYDLYPYTWILNMGTHYMVVFYRHEPMVVNNDVMTLTNGYSYSYSKNLTPNGWSYLDFTETNDTESFPISTFTNMIVWMSHDIKDTEGNVIITASGEPVPLVCDGTTCPATDVNTDNICDDCGLVFAVLRDYPIPDPYLVFTPEYQTRFPYAFIYNGENNTNHMIFSSIEPVYFNGAVVVENNDDDLSYLKYSVNGDTWKYDGGFSDGIDIVTDTVYPSFNMNDLDGNLAFKQNTDFFPIPLWVEMDNLTQGEMVKLSPTVVAIMATLTIVGIGCLASLVLLKIFGKRSLLYRK